MKGQGERKNYCEVCGMSDLLNKNVDEINRIKVKSSLHNIMDSMVKRLERYPVPYLHLDNLKSRQVRNITKQVDELYPLHFKIKPILDEYIEWLILKPSEETPIGFAETAAKYVAMFEAIKEHVKRAKVHPKLAEYYNSINISSDSTIEIYIGIDVRRLIPTHLPEVDFNQVYQHFHAMKTVYLVEYTKDL